MRNNGSSSLSPVSNQTVPLEVSMPPEQQVAILEQALQEIGNNKALSSDEIATQVALSLLSRIHDLETRGSRGRPSGLMDVAQFLRVILSNIWIIIVVAALGTGLTYVVVNAQKPIYETQTSLAVIPNIDDTAIPRPIQQIDVALGTYIQVLKSQSLNQRVAETLKSTYDSNLVDEITPDVKVVENSSIITVTVQSSNRDLAQAYAQEMVHQVSANNPLPNFEISYRLEVLDAPELPTAPVFPNKKISVMLGAAGSLIMGVMAGFIFQSYVMPRRRKAVML